LPHKGLPLSRCDHNPIGNRTESAILENLVYDGGACGPVAMKAALTLSNGIGELPRLLEFAAAFAGRSRLPSDEASRLLVIIDEVFSNIVRHGYGGSKAVGKIRVGLSFVRGCLRIAITDDGRAFDLLTAPTPDLDLPASLRPAGGLGIHFVKNLVDDAQYSRRGNRNNLALVRHVHPAEPAV
jgi:serine/threonine-protein kinase RsbW